MMMETKTPDTARSFTITYTPRACKTGGILAQLCIRCGGYSASNHDYCIQCVESLKKTCCHFRSYAIKPKTEKRTDHKKTEKKESKSKFCIGCKVSDVGTSGALCLICVAKRREKERQKNLHRYDYKDNHFGTGDLIRAYPEKDDSWRKDWRCTVCLQRVRPENKPMCYGCEIKQMLLAKKQVNSIVDDVDKELTNYKLEAIGVKNEFISAEPTEDETKWEISFEARKKSLEEIKNSINRLNPSKRQDIAKQKETLQFVDDLITTCQKHYDDKKPKIPEESMTGDS
ncbi:uncharacterized protein LOC111133122 isoform X1 [Crassostrea virginica]